MNGRHEGKSKMITVVVVVVVEDPWTRTARIIIIKQCADVAKSVVVVVARVSEKARKENKSRTPMKGQHEGKSKMRTVVVVVVVVAVVVVVVEDSWTGTARIRIIK